MKAAKKLSATALSQQSPRRFTAIAYFGADRICPGRPVLMAELVQYTFVAPSVMASGASCPVATALG